MSVQIVRWSGTSTERSLAVYFIVRILAVFVLIVFVLTVSGGMVGIAQAQTDCNTGNDVLETAPPKDMTPEEVIQKFGAMEAKVKEARSHYTYTQDLMVQTLKDDSVDGQFHEVTTVSYDDKGRRVEKVGYSEISTLRGIEFSPEDREDVRVFMPLILTTEDLPQYTVTYAGQQHVDDLDTYVFHVVPKKEEKNKRYFSGKIWVDNHDLQIVKACGKSVPEAKQKKAHVQELRPTFASYRQPVGDYWFPAFVRVDDTLTIHAETVQVREIVKFTGYKKTGTGAAKP